VNRRLWFILTSRGVDVTLQPRNHMGEADKLTSVLLCLVSEHFSRQEASGGAATVAIKRAALTLRDEWPPDFSRPPSGRLVLLLPWEFSTLPSEWVRRLNDNAAEVWVPSTFAQDALVSSRLRVPVHVVSHGVQTVLPPRPAIDLSTTVFLFHGGLLERKGVDVLLRAYLSAFSPSDNVLLYIHASYGQYFADEIAAASMDAAGARVVLDQRMVTGSELSALYRSTAALVLPYRGEGFGLPILEALSHGVRVVVTGRGPSQEIFPRSCLMVDSEPQPCLAGPCGDHTLFGAKTAKQAAWFEPSEVHLAQLLRDVFLGLSPPLNLTAAAEEAVRFSWPAVTAQLEERLHALTARA
jgi:glycosyltransferase involved in cell wall biosynthesis